MIGSTLSFEEVCKILSAYWAVKRSVGSDFVYKIAPHPHIGNGVFITLQSGFSIHSLENPQSPLLAICKVLEGELLVNVDGNERVFTAHENDTFLVCNLNNVYAEHKNLKLAFYPVCCDLRDVDMKNLHTLFESMIEEFDITFEDIYKSLHTYFGFGPFKAMSERFSPTAKDLHLLCVMLRNFSSYNFHLKCIAHEVGVSVSTITRHEIAGHKVKYWADIFKIRSWEALQGHTSAAEIAEILGYSNPKKLKDFLARHGITPTLSDKMSK